MYKQRHENSNKPETALYNANYVQYIATREGVACHDGKDHGLFGRLKQGAVVEFDSWQEISKLAKNISSNHITMFKGYISFKEDTAKEAGLLSKQDWQDYMEKHVFTIAEQNKIPQKNLQWVAAFHDKKGQPHLHIVFWDKNPQVNRQFVHSSVPNKIRMQLIKDTFSDRIFELGQIKNELSKKIRVDSKKLSAEVVEAVGKLGRRRYDLIRGGYREGLGDYRFTFANSTHNVIVPLLFQLKEMIPRNGRLNYQLLPMDTKDHVDNMVDTFLKEIPEMDILLEEYVEVRCKQAELYQKVTPEQREEYQKEGKKMIANGMMNMLRSLNQLEWEFQKEHHEIQEKQFLTEQIIGALMDLFRENQEKAGHSQNASKSWSSLSKEAKKEYALRNQDKGYEH